MSNYNRNQHRAREKRVTEGTGVKVGAATGTGRVGDNKMPTQKRWGSDYEIAKAHAVPSKGTVGVLGRNGQDYDVYSPGNPGYMGSPGHKRKTVNGNSRSKRKRT